MPYNPSGVFTPPNGTLAESGTTIRVAQHNPFVNDVSAALSQVLLRNGVAPMTGPLAMGGNRITGIGTAVNPGDAVSLSQVTPYSPWLASVSALAMTADDMVYATSATGAAKTKVTSFARTLLDDASASAMRTTLGLGSLATINSPVPIANGGTGATTAANARTGLGLGSLATLNTAPIANGGTGATTAASARSNLGLGPLATASTIDINSATMTGTLSIAGGGTGATTAANARTNLGLGPLATATTVPVANGGTGATTAANARTNLGLGSLATASTINNSNWSGTDLAVSNGGTGASDASGARDNLGLGTLAMQNIDTWIFPQATWNAGTNTQARPISPENLVTAINLLTLARGSQRWQNATASRVAGTSYQNTNSYPISVAVTADAASSSQGLRVSHDGTTFVAVGFFSNAGAASSCITAEIPPGHYYRVDTGLDGISNWAELR